MGQVNKKLSGEKPIIPLMKSEKEIDDFNVFSSYDDEILPGRLFYHLFGENTNRICGRGDHMNKIKSFENIFHFIPFLAGKN